MTWTPTDEEILQNSHFWISWAIIATLRYWRFRPKTAIVASVIWATFKEFAFDILIENDSLRNCLIDWVWYGFGTLAAIAVLELPDLVIGATRKRRKG
jgi:hypothetical protein